MLFVIKTFKKKPSKPTKTPIAVPHILFPQMRPKKHPKNTYSNTFGFNHQPNPLLPEKNHNKPK